MNSQITHSILILDDDDIFRGFLTDLLESRGFYVIPASTVGEATSKLGPNFPVLAIVDYRLPQSDGITWITKLREEGRNFPIVFLSGIWCDEKTFDWLRNILRVSLILKKPIVPELFIQQIESLLPLNLTTKSLEDKTAASNKAGRGNLFLTANNFRETLNKLRETNLANRGMQQIPQTSEDRQSRLAALRENYAGELFQSWQELVEVINQVSKNREDAILRANAVSMAHKIRGTAGSIGFTEIGEIAGKLEDLTQGFDPDDPLNQVVWSEIDRALPIGQEIVKTILAKTSTAIGTHSHSDNLPYKILFVGDRKSYGDYLQGLAEKILANITIAESAAGAKGRLRVQTTPFDIAVLDMDCIGRKENLFELMKEIRVSQVGKSIGFALIGSAPNALSKDESVYSGISAFVKNTNFKNEIEEVASRLLSTTNQRKPRILLVDDDEVLTKYLTELLSAQGMVVQSLHKPIKIVSTAKQFSPDLILLDVIMPGLSGYDVCRILRATDEWRNTPVLFLTSKNDQAGRTAAFQAGANDFLSKPIISEELLTRVKTQIETTMYKRQTYRDELTGLMNGSDFIKSANDMLKQAQEANLPLTLCLLNMEAFSKSSAQHGWSSMQKVLSIFGELLNSRFRANDLRGRIGEDGFVLSFLGERMDCIEKAMFLLRTEFADIKFSSESVGYFKTIFNYGVAEFPKDGSSLNSLLDLANQRLESNRVPTLR